jgi:hypothetical protein
MTNIGLLSRTSLFVGFPFFVVIINLPLQFQIVNGDTPIMAGVHLLPLLAAAAVGKFETSFAVRSTYEIQEVHSVESFPLRKT